MPSSPRRTRLLATAGLAASAVVAALAVAGPATAAPATGQVKTVAGAEAVPNSYVVVLKAGAPSAGLAAKYGGTARKTWTHALHGFSASMTPAQAARLAADPAVAYVQVNAKISLDATQTGATWGLDRIDQRDLPLSTTYTYSTTASNVHAYVIDTGIRTAHNEFGGRAVIGHDSIGDGQNGQDCNGHGTHVSGTVGGATYGVAKQVQLVGVRVLDCEGSGTTEQVVDGIDWVTANAVKPAVANMSLGGGVDAVLDAAVVSSINSGVTYAIAAGNGNALGIGQPACNYSPARVPAAITVGATQNNDARASFSNYGTCLDLFGPGVNITSSWNSSNTATNTISGTSMATPHVAGAAALYLADHPTATPQQVRDALVANATPNKVTSPGTGSPNLLLYTGGGTSTPTVTVTNPGSKSGVVGTPISSFTLSASPAGSYTWTGTGLPPGVTVSSGGTVSGTPTAAGTYPTTVTATGTAGSGSATFTFTVTGGGGSCSSPGQKLANPGFETSGGWTTTSGVISTGTSTRPARTGTKLAYLDGYGTTHTDTATQSVAVPAGCSSYTLSFWYRIITSETTTTTAYDKLTVKAGSTTLVTLSNLNKNTAYQQATYTLSGVGGTTVAVSFSATEDSSLQTSFLIDDTGLNVS